MKLVIEDNDDLNGFRDVLGDVYGFDKVQTFSREEIIKVFYELPEYIQGMAFVWGDGDTEFEEAVYKHLVK